MAGTANSFRDTLAKPVIKVAMKEMKTGAGHLISRFNRSASAAIQGGLAKREGNILKFKLKRYGGVAGRGYNLKINSRTGAEHVEVVTEGHMNYGVKYTPRETTYEARCSEIKSEAAMDAGIAFARLAIDNYMDQLAYGSNYVPFNPGNIGVSYSALMAKMRRMGVKGKPNVARSTNMWEHMHNQQHTNTANALMSENMKSFNFIDEDVNSIPTYKTGDRAGLCLKVYSACQTGCELVICGGAAAANRRIIRRGEVLDICGVKAVDMMSHRTQGYNRQFVAQCDVWADGNGVAVVSIEPELLPLHSDYQVANSLGQTATNGGRKNVDSSPKDGAMVNVSTGLSPNCEYEQTLVWFDDAMVKIAADVDMDCGGMTENVRISFGDLAGDAGRAYFSKDGNIQNGAGFLRWDMSLDYINLFPEFVTRLVGIKVADC